MIGARVRDKQQNIASPSARPTGEQEPLTRSVVHSLAEPSARRVSVALTGHLVSDEHVFDEYILIETGAVEADTKSC